MQPSVPPPRANPNALAFMGGLSLFFAAAACLFFWQSVESAGDARTLRDQERVWRQENARLRAEAGRLRTDFEQMTSDLKESRRRLAPDDEARSMALAQLVRQKQQNDRTEEQLKETLDRQKASLDHERAALEKEKETLQQELAETRKKQAQAATASASEASSNTSSPEAKPEPRRKQVVRAKRKSIGASSRATR
jgi:hypothetical protein